MKLLIAIPTLDYIHVEFMRSLIALTNRLKDDGIDFHVEIKSGTLVYVARDLLATKARQEGYTHVLWLDSDMVFTEDLVDDLLFVGKPFVTGIAHSRRPPHCSCIFRTLRPVDRYSFKDYGSEPFQIGGCGMACVLMETEIIRAIWEKYTFCFLPMEELGEDLAFCQRAIDLGYEIWADPAVRIGHIGHITIWPEDEEGWQNKIDGIERFL